MGLKIETIKRSLNDYFIHNFQQTVVYLLLTVAYAVASTLVFQVQSDYNSNRTKSTWTVNQLLVTSVGSDIKRVILFTFIILN